MRKCRPKKDVTCYCVDCGKRLNYYGTKRCEISQTKHIIKIKRKLDVHHIDYNKQNCKENNLISLCQNCHITTNGNRDFWFAYYTYIMENFK